MTHRASGLTLCSALAEPLLEAFRPFEPVELTVKPSLLTLAVQLCQLEERQSEVMKAH